jgi:chromosome segregation ATPase
MRIDELSEQFAAFLECARAVLDLEIGQAKKIVAAANTEKNSAQAALAELQDQRASAQKQLDAVMKDLHRGSTLVGINREITEARKMLEKLQGETAEATTALEALQKQRTEAEAKLVALGNEAQRQLGIRLEAEGVMAKLRSQLDSVQIGR